MDNLTPWYPPEIKPVRIGDYECKYCVERGATVNRHYWNGKRWCMSRDDPLTGLFSVIWRGLRHGAARETP